MTDEPTGCIYGCVHFALTDELKAKARQEAEFVYPEEHDTPLSIDRKYLGALGQNGVFVAVAKLHTTLQWQAPTYIPEVRNAIDFKHNNQWNDVKTSPMGDGWHYVIPNNYLLVSDKQKVKVLDNYVFVKIDEVNGWGHIAGVVPYTTMWQSSNTMISPELKSPCHYVRARHTIPFADYIVGNIRTPRE